MAKFTKENPKPGPGRPQGMKNKNCMAPVFWYNLIEERSKDMGDKEVIEIAFKCLNLLMPKVAAIPATPGDSVSNGLAAFQLMNGLAPVNTPLESNPNASGGPHANGS